VSKATRAERDLADQLDAIYETLPTIVCQGKCAIACGAVPLTEAEARRLQVVTHQKPRTVLGFKALADFVPGREIERCIYLTDRDRCRAYAVRPLICRVWGLVSSLSCHHGCVPDRWLSESEFLRLAQAVERIGGRQLRTALNGLVNHGDSFTRIGSPTRPETEILDNAERVRGLRAVHGGRILLADKRYDP
jgi:Fe-S-cluster containining protein